MTQMPACVSVHTPVGSVVLSQKKKKDGQLHSVPAHPVGEHQLAVTAPHHTASRKRRRRIYCTTPALMRVYSHTGNNKSARQGIGAYARAPP